MPLLSARHWRTAQAIAGIGYANPFLPERIELERKALGRAFVSSEPFLQFRSGSSVSGLFPNADLLRTRGEKLLETMRRKLADGEPASERELEVYENLALYQLYARYMSAIVDLPVGRFHNRPEDDIIACHSAFSADFQRYLQLPERTLPSQLDSETIFAGLFQIERAFFHIFRHIIGASLPAAKLRASIWQSIFTHDMRRYLRSLHRFMGDMTTLITGPSGTGKELVAQSIAFSRFVEFDAKKQAFATNYATSFTGLNLTAIAPTLIESELFGHARGAFTDAKKERHGYLDEEMCPKWGSVFLDEIGELEGPIQVKLLRVLQNREFQRVGESETRFFVGKLIAATNRDLATEMDAGRFREDLYYRLCADRVVTPSLREQLRDSPEDLANFVLFIARRLLADLPEEAAQLTRDVVGWIEHNLGDDYPWPGNIRELEQCVRSIMIRGCYTPTGRRPKPTTSRLAKFIDRVAGGELTREELLSGYFSLVYSQAGSYRAAARQLGVDWRTVKEIVDTELARQLTKPPNE